MSAQTESNGNASILIVEDEQILAMDLQRSLTELGYAVAGVTDRGVEAVELSALRLPDVVLMDIRLPGEKDGIAAAAEIRRQLQIPVVFLTANVSDETLTRARDAGPYGYVVKPFRPRELNATILLALHQHRIARELFAEHTWLRTVLGSLTDGVIASDDSGLVRFINSSAAALTGWSRAEAIGERIEIVYPLSTLDGKPGNSLRRQEPSARGTVLRKRRFILHRRNGTTIPIEDAAARIGEGPRSGGAVIVFQDITERLRREREETEERDRLEERVQTTAQALDATRAELRALSAHLMRVQEEERRRIGRELHDDLGQKIATLEFKLTRLHSRLSDAPAELQNDLCAVSTEAVELANSLRAVSHGLHSSIITDLGIEPALRALIEEHQKAGANVTASVENIPRQMPFEIAVTLYRVAQEGLRNAARHAAGASVRVMLSREDKQVSLSIEDSGPGFDLVVVRERGGLGLLNMQERARLAGGNFTLRTAPGRGTSLLVRVPLEASSKTTADSQS